MTGVSRYDRFMVLNKIGRIAVLRRYFTPTERWCYLAGIVGLAADSPIRGWMFLTEKVPADESDVADAAGVSTRVAKNTLEKALKYGLIEPDNAFDCLWVPDFDTYNPKPPKTDRTAAERKRNQRARENGEDTGDSGDVTPMSRRDVTDRDMSHGHAGKEVKKEVRKEDEEKEVPPAVVDARGSRLGHTVQQVLGILKGSSRLHVDDIGTPVQITSAIDAHPQASAIPAAHEAVCWAEDPTWRGTDGGRTFLLAMRKQAERLDRGERAPLRVAESKAARRIRELQDQIDALPAEDAA